MHVSAYCYTYPRSSEIRKKDRILDGFKMASRIGAMFECYLGSAKIAATHTGSGRSTDRTVSNEIAKVQWTSADLEGVTWIDMELVNHHGHTDMSETEHKARVDAGSGRMVGMHVVVLDSGMAYD